MPTTDSIARPSLLLKPVQAKGRQADADSVAKAVPERDTLGLLSPKVPKEFRLTDVRFAEEGYFKGSKYFKPGWGTHVDGVLGDPAPYAVSNDNTVTSLLLGCFVLAMVSFSVSRSFILRQVQGFFRTSRSGSNVTETTSEVRFQLFLILQTSLLLSVIYYLFAHGGGNDGLGDDSQLSMIGIYCGIFTGYFLLKHAVYSIVNWTFFDRKNNRQWAKVWLFLTSLEGVLLFPLVLLQVYFELSLHAALVYTLTVMLLIKILTFYKSYAIFFRRSGVSLQIFLYFCALELMPLMALWGVLVITGNYLKINF
ncbi:MAG: DUF4271 domain-containing protein [Prevotella sp.]|nr:DUF4271 domain-containing protein [Prevotella sp.]